jgi:hypothetical protein
MNGERFVGGIVEEEREIDFALFYVVRAGNARKTLLLFTEVCLKDLFAKHKIIVPWQLLRFSELVSIGQDRISEKMRVCFGRIR